MSNVFYWLLWGLCRFLSRIFLHYRVVHEEYVPRTGGVLIAANHASYADIPLLGCGVRRRLYFVGRSNLFQQPLLNWWLRCLGWIPLKPNRVDRKALGVVVDLLKAGNAVVIFPEGTRTPDGRLQPGKPGVGVIVAQTGCPVVPVYLEGTFQVLPTGAKGLRCHPVRVIFGQALDFTQARKQQQGKELYHTISRTIMKCIAELGQVEQPADHLLSTQISPTTTTKSR